MFLPKPVIVFFHSDIQYQWQLTEGQKPSAENNGTRYYTTGRLEEALEKGYDVYVLYSDIKLHPQDKWWVGLIDEDHVFLLDTDRGRYMGASDPNLLDICHRLFEYLEVDWPDDLTTWTEVRGVLDRLGFSGKPVASVESGALA